jgi:hypothetical protein
MYASVTSYSDIYTQAYRDRRGDGTSFDKGVLPPLISEYCKAIGSTAVLDVSGGQGALSQLLRSDGITVFTTDLVADPEAGIFSLNLSEYDQSKNKHLTSELAGGFSGKTYLTSCFDVLEHIDSEHVFCALRNLYEISSDRLVVSISTRPSVFYNRLHSTLVPIRTWIRLFSEAGFRVVDTQYFLPATSRRVFSNNTNYEHNYRWQSIDLFRDVANGEPQYLVLEKCARNLDWQDVERRFNHILDIHYRLEKRRRFQLPQNERFCFNIGCASDWALVRPFLDVLPRAQTEFVLQRRHFDPLLLNIVSNWLTRTGVQYTTFEDPRELPWERLSGTTFVSASESTASSRSIDLHYTTAAARLKGCRTVTLQSDLLSEKAEGRVVTHVAEHLLHWSFRDANCFLKGGHQVFGTDVPWRLFADGQVKNIGSAYYTDQLLEAGEDYIETRFGVERSRFGQVVLLGTRKQEHRGSEGEKNNFPEQVADVISRAPSTLFLLRPNGNEEMAGLIDPRGENVRLLDDACCIMADLQLNRLLPHIDVVVAPLSPLAISGAISRKATFVYDADTALDLREAEPHSIRALPNSLAHDDSLTALKQQAAELAANYGDVVDDQYYERFLEVLRAPRASPSLDIPLAVSLSLCSQIEVWRDEAERGRQALERVAQERASLQEQAERGRQALERVAQERASLQEQAERSRQALERVAQERASLQEQAERSRQALERVAQERASLQEQAERSRQALERVAQERASLQEQAERSRQALKRVKQRCILLESRVKSSRDQANTLKSKAAARRRELDMILSSRSWHVARALQRIAAKVRAASNIIQKKS